MKNIKLWTIIIVHAAFCQTQARAEGGYSRFVPEKRHTINADIGGGLIVSDIYAPHDGYHYKKFNTKGGLDWRVQYSYTFGIGIGFGLQYSGFHTGFNGGDLDVNLHYVAPQFVYRFKLNSFVFSAGAGIGYAHYKENSGIPKRQIPQTSGYYELGYDDFSQSGVGMNYNVGAEYMIFQNIGIGVTIGSVLHFFDNKYKTPYGDEDINGIGRLNILGGLRFYF